MRSKEQGTIKKIRSTKLETISKRSKKSGQCSKREIGFQVLDFLRFPVLGSICFGFRNSDFGILSAGTLRAWRPFDVAQDMLGGRIIRSRMANELILIIEDNEKNRKLIRDLLQAKGYQTIESETAEEGLRLAEERKPALILMDIQLSGMDGIAAMKQLKAAPATRSIPVMAITASAMTHNRESMLAEGFDGYQIKPFNLSAFLADIDRLISQNRS